jgi:poly(ADP-ribose) glycohydrolase
MNKRKNKSEKDREENKSIQDFLTKKQSTKKSYLKGNFEKNELGRKSYLKPKFKSDEQSLTKVISEVQQKNKDSQKNSWEKRKKLQNQEEEKKIGPKKREYGDDTEENGTLILNEDDNYLNQVAEIEQIYANKEIGDSDNEISTRRKEEHKEERNNAKYFILPTFYKSFWRDVKKILYSIVFQAKIKSKLDFYLILKKLILRNYLEKSESSIDLRGLSKFFSTLPKSEEQMFLSETIPYIASLALNTDKTFKSKPKLKILSKNTSSIKSLTTLETATLLSLSFLCILPLQKALPNLPKPLNLNSLYKHTPLSSTKLSFICSYFSTISTSFPNTILTIERISLNLSSYTALDSQFWTTQSSVLSNLTLKHAGCIEDSADSYSVDFANKALGGGVLGGGALQEEIMFLAMPELLVSRMVCEVMGEREAVVVCGVRKYGRYKGYGDMLSWQGVEDESVGEDSCGRAGRCVVAVDALRFGERDKIEQFDIGFVLRELNKAYIGFQGDSWEVSKRGKKKSVATGKWGCGAFKGNPQLKFFLQWMAASANGRDMIFYTFRDSSANESEESKGSDDEHAYFALIRRDDGLENLENVIRKVKGKTVGEIFTLLMDFEDYFYNDLLKNESTANVDIEYDDILFSYILSHL